jgi:hypothetical protein
MAAMSPEFQLATKLPAMADGRWPAAGARGEPAGVDQAASVNGWISLAMALPFSISATRNS